MWGRKCSLCWSTLFHPSWKVNVDSYFIAAYLHEGGSVYIESFASIPQSDFRMGSFFLLSVGLIITQPLVNLQHGMPTFMPIWNQAQNQLTLLYWHH